MILINYFTKYSSIFSNESMNYNNSNIFPSMEEKVNLLASFLEQISYTQQKTDALLHKFSLIPDSYAEIFENINIQSNGTICTDQIINYWKELSIAYGNEDDNANNCKQIIKNYFDMKDRCNWQLDQFIYSLQPKNQCLNTVQYQSISSKQRIFYQIILTIVQGFNNLEKMRTQLCKYSQEISEYFHSSNIEKLNKESLRWFMQSQQIYTQRKYVHVSWYIFGELLSEIQWDLFLSVNITEKCKTKMESYLPAIDEQDCRPLLLESLQTQRQSTCEKNTSYKNLKLNGEWSNNQTIAKQRVTNQAESNDGVKKLFDQIDGIERKMKEKKRQRENREKQAQKLPVKVKNQSYILQQKPQSKPKEKVMQQFKKIDFDINKYSMKSSRRVAGKLYTRRSTSKILETSEVKPQNNRTITNRKVLQNKIENNLHDLEQKQYVSELYKKYFKNDKQIYSDNNHRNSSVSRKEENPKDYISSQQNYKNVLNRSASQAQMKIQELQRKASWKMSSKQYQRSNYLNYFDTRLQQTYKKDEYIPSYFTSEYKNDKRSPLKYSPNTRLSLARF